MAFEGFVSFGGVELVNNARAAAYSVVPVRCVCGELAASLRDEPYTSPDADQAPWWDPGVPESKGFWGLVGLGITGADSGTVERQWTELLGDGGVSGAGRHASREVEVKALALAADDTALSYGLAWLASALEGSACRTSCTGDELCVYTACPTRPVVGGGAVDCASDTPPPGAGQPVEDWDPAAAGDYLARVLYDVACVDGPTVESRTRLADGVTAEVSFTLKAGVPQWHRTPVPVIDLDLSDLPDDVHQSLIYGYDPVAILDDCPDPAAADCMSENPYCTLPPFPAEPVIELADPCYPTSPFTAARVVFTIPADTNPGWLEKVPVMTVRAGSLPLHRLTMRWYDNPLGVQCNGDQLDACQACAEITLPFLPRNSTLTIDSRTRRATVECPGQGIAEAAHQLYGPRGGLFQWPTFDCSTGMCVEILAEASVSLDVGVTVDLVTREGVA